MNMMLIEKDTPAGSAGGTTVNQVNNDIVTQPIQKVNTTSFQFSIIRSDNAPLSKRIFLKDGMVTKEAAGKMYSGTGDLITVNNLLEFAAHLKKLHSAQAITLGIWDESIHTASVNICTRQQKSANMANVGNDLLITRTLRDATHSGYFFFPQNSPCLVYFDVDVSISMDEVRNRLIQAFPAIVETDMLQISSSSARVTTRSGATVTGDGGTHTYIVLENGSFIADLRRALLGRDWLHGKGWVFVSDCGQLYPRCSFDDMVFSPERLIFEGAVVLPKEWQQNKLYKFTPGTVPGKLFTHDMINPLTTDELRKVKELQHQEKERKKVQAEQTRKVWIDQKAKDILKENKRYISPAEAVETAKNLARHQIVGGSDQIITVQQSGDVAVPVWKIIMNAEKYDGMCCKDPLEPTYNNGSTTGIIYADNLTIFSQAHGGILYRLQLDEPGFENILSEKAKGTDKTWIEKNWIRLLLPLQGDPIMLDRLLKAVKGSLTKVGITTVRSSFNRACKATGKAPVKFSPVVNTGELDIIEVHKQKLLTRFPDFSNWKDSVFADLLSLSLSSEFKARAGEKGLLQYLPARGYYKSIPMQRFYEVIHRELSQVDPKNQFDHRNVNGIGSMLRDAYLLMSEEELERVEAARRNRSHINLLNGVLDVRTGKLHPHDRRHFFMYALDCEWSGRDMGPNVLFEQLLSEVFSPNDRLRFLAICRATLLGRIEMRKFLLMVGPSNCGKSTLVSLFSQLLGSDGVGSISLKDLTNEKRDSNFELSSFLDKQMIVVNEVGKQGIVKDNSVITKLSGDDGVSARKKNIQTEAKDRKPCGLMWFIGNAPLVFSDSGEAIANRVIYLKCKDRVAHGGAVDTQFKQKVMTNNGLEAILRTVLNMGSTPAGLRPFQDAEYAMHRWLGIKDINVNRQMLRRYHVDVCPVTRWAHEMLIRSPHKRLQVGTPEPGNAAGSYLPRDNEAKEGDTLHVSFNKFQRRHGLAEIKSTKLFKELYKRAFNLLFGRNNWYSTRPQNQKIINGLEYDPLIFLL